MENKFSSNSCGMWKCIVDHGENNLYRPQSQLILTPFPLTPRYISSGGSHAANAEHELTHQQAVLTAKQTHLVWPHQQENPTREAYGLSGSVHEKAHLGLNLSSTFLKALRLVAPIICWSSMFHLWTTLLKKKYFQQSREHLILLNFSVWPFVHLLFLSSVNKSWSPIAHREGNAALKGLMSQRQTPEGNVVRRSKIS